MARNTNISFPVLLPGIRDPLYVAIKFPLGKGWGGAKWGQAFMLPLNSLYQGN